MDSQQNNLQQGQVQIDEEWISQASKDQPMIDHGLLMCMICYGIPLGQFAQCIQCGRIFCQKDYESVVSTLNACPNCKNAPFRKRPKPHILYTNVFERITFKCNLCNEQNNPQQKKAQKKQDPKKEIHKTYTKDELSMHINDLHKAKIMDFNVLYDFQIHFEKGTDKIIFDLYQNMEMNQKLFEFQNKKNMPKSKFPYQLDNGDYLKIDLQKQTAFSVFLNKSGRIVKKISKQLKKDVQYQIFEILLDYDYKYYTQYYQQLIMKEYQEFVKNKKKNQFNFDIKDQRYRISFTKMKQTNTFTDYQRPIRKTTVKFQ